MPERISGFYMATVVNKPGTVEFFDQITNEWQSEVHIEEIAFNDLREGLQYKCLSEMNITEQTGANIIGFKDQNGKYIINPAADTSFDKGTSLIALGTEIQIKSLREYCG
jgi:voltage-gated potassium channel